MLVANYSSGSVASLPVKADGSLGEHVSFFKHSGSSVNPQGQKEPHAHCIVVSPDNKYAFAADLGTDQILCYRLDPAAAKLTPNKPPFARSPAGDGTGHKEACRGRPIDRLGLEQVAGQLQSHDAFHRCQHQGRRTGANGRRGKGKICQ